MKGVIVHGALLAVMLIYGYRTWNKKEEARPAGGEVVMWTRAETDLEAIELTSEKRTVRIERRVLAKDSYWWGTETKQVKKPKLPEPPKPVPDDPATPDVDESKAAPPPPPAEPEFTEETVTTEFPVGPEGEKLVKQYARMRAIKGIGVPSEQVKKDYGLAESQTSVGVVFGDGAKTLVVGGKVFGGSDRYLQDLDTGKVFVVLGTMVSLLEGGEASLRPVELRAFDPKSAQQIEIAANGKTKTVARIKVKPPAPETPDPHAPPPSADELVETWGQGQTADTTAANFIDKLEKLRPSSYDPKTDAASLDPVVVLTYKDRGGKQLGTFKLLRRVKAQPEGSTSNAQTFEYFVWTERTRVPAPVSPMQAERVEQDVSTLFTETTP
jgi:hypothetical protein